MNEPFDRFSDPSPAVRPQALEEPRFDAVLFDCDGVLIDSESVSRTSYFAAWEACGGPPIPEELRHEGLGMTDRDYLRFLMGRLDARLDEAAFADARIAGFRHLSDGIPVFPGIPEALAVLAQRGIPCAVATSSLRSKLEASLAGKGLLASFSASVSSDEVERGKPAPDLFLEAAQRLGLPASRCLVVEDSPAGVASAVSAGATALGVAHSVSEALLREAGARWTLSGTQGLSAFFEDLFAPAPRCGPSPLPSALPGGKPAGRLDAGFSGGRTMCEGTGRPEAGACGDGEDELA